MLEAMRQNSRSAIIYILFAILIAAFVISFGPGSPSGSGGGSTGGHYAAKVAGNEIGEQDFHFAYVALGAASLPGNMAREQRVKEFVMDRLIERELLAHEAEAAGLAASEKEVTDMLTSGKMIILGTPRRVEGYVYKDGVFDYERFRMVAQNHYGITVKRLIEVEQRELLADKMRELSRTATKVSPDEVKADFEDKGRQANLEYVRFTPRRYEEEVNLTDAEVDSWSRAHEAEVKKVYDERKFLYQKQDPTAHLRRILIELPKDAPEAKVKEAQDRLTAAQATLKSGTPFSEVARTTSEDGYSKIRGGDMGWRKKGFTGLGDAVDAQVFAAKAGDLIGPARSDRGLELLKIEGFRQGEITLDQARTEIAEELLRTEKTKELAKAAAAAAAQKVRAGGKLADLFPKGESDADEAKPKTGNKIQVEETGLFSRRGDVIQGLGPSPDLARTVFTTMKVGEIVGPLDIAGSTIVATLKEHKDPDLLDWDKRKDEIIQEYQRTKWAEVVQGWTKHLCTQQNTAGNIRVNPEILAYEGGPAKDPLGGILGERKYEPCSQQRPF